MSAPEPHTSADQALSSFMGAAIGAPGIDFAPNQPTTDEKQIARWKRDSELLDAIRSACWDVRFISHSNGDDYSIGIEIVSHFMQPPCERVIGENWNENLRAALEQAMTAEAYPPARPERSAPAAGDAQTVAARDVLAERHRQISAEGWSALHDDAYTDAQLALAASCYARPPGEFEIPGPPQQWPWPSAWRRPGNRRRELVKAGALILAEIERLDRAAQQAEPGAGR